MEARAQKPSIFQLLITAAFVILVLAYIVIALNTQDAIWFWPIFDEQSYETILNCYGEETILHRGDPNHQAITELFNDQLSGRKYWDSLTMSDESYAYYQSSDAVVVLEFHYSPTVRIHSSVAFFKNVDTLVIPLYGRHAQTRPVFGRTHGISTAGSFHLETFQPLQDYVNQQGLCEIQP